MPALTDLFTTPVVQAPMAGGGSCPPLASEVSEAGGIGFLAAGYKTPEAMRDEIAAVRKLTSRPFGVNVFMPQPPPPDPAAAGAYRERLSGEAARYGAACGDPDAGSDDSYDAKTAILLDDPVPVVSFTMGCPDRATLEAFSRVGTYTLVTVTSVAEALAARQAGADAVCVQGVEAGGHQGGHHDDPALDGSGKTLLVLVTEISEVIPLPIVAAGGVMRGGQIAALLAAGAGAAQLGTAFLVCPESGADPLHKRALTDPAFDRTELTRAFSGRPARGLVNRFVREHGRYAPAAYPQLHHLTSPLRKAAARAGDPHGMSLWAGQGHRLARELPAARLVQMLTAELGAARSGAA